MTPEQRERAMDELGRLTRRIDQLLEAEFFELDPDDPDDDDEAEFIQHERWGLEHRRDLLLNTFPEIQYWPAETEDLARSNHGA